MKLLYLSIFCLILSSFCTCFASVETVDQAVKLLSLKNHVQNPFHIFNSLETSAENMYNAQLDAIKFLGRTKDPNYTAILISYLDYPTSPGAAIADSIYARRKSTESNIKSAEATWPAFGAIMDIPGSERILSSYVLSESNPLEYRFTALLALKYKNKTVYNETLNQFKLADQGIPNTLKLLNAFQSQDIRFCGLMDLQTLEKISTRLPQD